MNSEEFRFSYDQIFCCDCLHPIVLKGSYLCLQCGRTTQKKIAIPRSKPMSDSVNHPSHYNAGKIEVIDFIEDQQLNFSRGNVVKYVSRAGKKLGEVPAKELEDLKKAAWYLQREIENLEKLK